MVEEVKIDTNLYSRQIGTFGLETMGKLIKMNVLIIGMRGLGVEIAKNLCLAGPKSVTIYDPTQVAVADRGANFYIKESDVGNTTRAEASVGDLSTLNPTVTTSVLPEFTNEMVTNYNVVVITEFFWSSERMVEINELCRANRVGFIATENMGLTSYAFLDYGNEFMVTDKDGEATKQFIISSIEQCENPVVHVHEDKRHSYQDGDYVKFIEVEGMAELNDIPHIEIYDTKAYSFRLRLDTSSFGAYARQGLVEDIKVPQPVAFKSLADSIKDPAASTAYGCLEPMDMNFFGMGRSEQLHLAIGAVHQFKNSEGRYPNDNEADLAQVVDKCKQINAAFKESNCINVEEVDEAICRKVAAYSTCSITSQAAMFGGFIAQEVVKFTGKYMPLKQWAHYDCFESLPAGEANREPMNCRYDDQIKIYGREVQEKLGNVKTFMIGAGALGCEYVKAMALMGLSCGPNGSVTVTDNDNIEISNLNRQFLFRQPDVGNSKAETACAKAKAMNPDLKVTTHQAFVSPDTEDLFNDDFWDSLDFIVNAVDNIKARLYVDRQCVWYEKPLLESGTLGTKANSQMIVPHKTQAYGDSQDPPEESIPMCTLRNFPNQIEHCIEWGRDQFNTLFCSRVQDAGEFLKGPDAFVAQSRQNNTSAGVRTQLHDINELVTLKQTGDVERVIKEARDIFNSNYDHSIRDLKALFPDDHMDSSGQPFWSGPKRSPQPETFNAADPLHLDFVWTCANLIFANIGLPALERAAVEAIAVAMPAAEYVRKVIAVETPEEAKEREAAGRPAPQSTANESDDDEPVITQLLAGLSVSTQTIQAGALTAADFEKDDDSNFHIDFITACSNLRARNYKITECDRNKTKMIAGKIIPAIATTTAMITGVVSNEIYKYAQGFNDIEKFKNAFVNLALPSIMMSQPDDIIKNKSKEFDPIMCGPITCLPEGYTNYDKIVLQQGSMTFQQIFDWLRDNKGVEISMVTCGEVALYNAYLPGNKHAPRLAQTPEDIHKQISGKDQPAGRRYLKIDVGGSIIENGADFQMPVIKYYFA